MTSNTMSSNGNGDRPAANCETSDDEIISVNWQEGDLDNPYNWSGRRKWLVTGFSCFMCTTVGLNALALSSATAQISDRFNISDASFPNSYWSVTAWNFGAAVFPVIVVPAMEDFSVRYGYLSSYLVFLIFLVPQAVAQNYATLIVTRFFAGGAASCVQNGVSNIVTDLWVGEESSLPVTLFIFSYLFGFTLGPTFGSSIAQFLSWRWIIYIELIIGGVMLPFAWLSIQETRGKIILKMKAKELTRYHGKRYRAHGADESSIVHLLYMSTIRPLYLFLTEPVVFFFTIWCALSIGNVFLASQSLYQVLHATHGFNEIQAGYAQAAMAVGLVIGFLICVWQNNIYTNASKNSRSGLALPENRLQLSIPASLLCLSGGLFIYGWTSYSYVPWIAPVIAIGVVGVGIMVVVQCDMLYLTDSYKQWSGSVVSAVACIENLNSAFLPLSAQSMYTNLGYRWASTLLALIAFALSFAPVILYWKGPSIRKRSPWMCHL